MSKNSLFINKKVWSSFTDEELENYKAKIFDHYRKFGFPYFKLSEKEINKVFNNLKKLDASTLLKNDNILSQHMLGLNVVNYYMPHMWETKCNGFTTPLDAFNNDDMLRKAIDKRIRFGDNMSDAGMRKVLSWVHGTHRVSNFRPTIAKYMYETYGGDKNLDFSSGYGGRLLGFLSTNDKCKEYIGVEPNIKTYNQLCLIKDEILHNKKIVIYNEAFEDLQFPDKSFDFIFSSPPYFNTEEYGYDKKQSFIRFPTKESWRVNFLLALIKNSYDFLKEDGTFAINIANVKNYKDLEKDTLGMAKEIGFKLIKTYKMSLSSLMSKGFKYEPIFVFKK